MGEISLSPSYHHSSLWRGRDPPRSIISSFEPLARERSPLSPSSHHTSLWRGEHTPKLGAYGVGEIHVSPFRHYTMYYYHCIHNNNLTTELAIVSYILHSLFKHTLHTSFSLCSLSLSSRDLLKQDSYSF